MKRVFLLFVLVALHPTAALFEEYFDVDKAAEEHQGYTQMLERNGIRVYTVSEILSQMSRADMIRCILMPPIV